MRTMKPAALAAIFFGLAGAFLTAQDQPKIQEEVVVRWWLVPIYAMNKDGSPAVGLKPEDFEVYLHNQKIPVFDLHKKEFQVARAPRESPSGGIAAPFEKKLVFLVFDSAFSNYELLERAKNVSETMMAQEAQGAQFIVFSIEPFGGLKTVVGPTRDRGAIAQSIEKHVSGKKADYLRTSAMDNTTIRNVYPPGSPLGARNPDDLMTPGRRTNLFQRLDNVEKRRMASVYAQALMTLNVILGYFKDNSKVIYLFSCGIPSGALEWKSDGAIDSTVAPEDSVYFNLTPDNFNITALVDVARSLNRNGSLIFLINPSGTRMSIKDQDSGEQSLRILADESGGRYYEGPENEIAKEIAGMEAAYYEISFPDADEFPGPEMDFEIRPRNPDLEIYTVKRVSRGRPYGQMGRLERQVLVLNILDRGPYAQTLLKVIDTELQPVSTEGGVFNFAIRLPRELSRSEWDIFKVWRKADAGKIMMDEDRMLCESPELAVDVKQRKGFRHGLVLVHRRTGTALVFQK